MPALTSRLTTGLGRMILARQARRGIDLSKVKYLPASTLMPLRRDGMDPVPELEALREQGPITRLPLPFGVTAWLVTGHEASQQVLADTTSYSTDIRHLFGTSGNEQHIGGLGFTDPPEHTRLRKILTPEFTMRRLARLKPRIAEIVETQLDEMAAVDGPVDLVSHFAVPIPFQVICELIGLPYEDRAEFHAMGSARFDLALAGKTFGAVSQSREFLFEAVRRQREHPGDGLLGKIITDLGDEVSDHDLGGLIDGLFTGGFETTASMISLGGLLLLQDPDAAAVVRDDDSPTGTAVAGVVEEMLRYLSVVQIAFPRFARHDLEVAGTTVKAGEAIICSLSAADRDTVLTGVQSGFDPRRRPTPHLAFGHGFHRCVGAELARMELRAAFPALLRRFPDLRLAVDPAELSLRQRSLVFGVDEVPVLTGPR